MEVSMNLRMPSTTPERTGSVGKTEFFQLLVTQLKYQDPMNPIEDRDFIAQLAQFSVLEEMQQLNRSQAIGLLDRMITFRDSASDEVMYGPVTSVSMAGGGYQIMVGDTKVRMEDILEIWA